MTYSKIFSLLFCICCVLIVLSGCSDNQSLNADFSAPKPVPGGVKKGTPLGDARVKIYNDLGVITYMNPDTSRFYYDVVSDQETLNLSDSTTVRADSSAAILCIHMLRDELYEQLPKDNKKLMPRNFYLVKNNLTSGSGYSVITYDSYLWYNSTHDVTIGRLDATNLDTTSLEGSFYYALASILRSYPRNASFLDQFNTARTDAQENEQAYYFYVTDQQSAYENGFVTADQTKIKGKNLDFDTYAAWAVTVDPAKRDSVLDNYSIVSKKYQILLSMFRQEGIDLEKINAQWQESPYNPDAH